MSLIGERFAKSIRFTANQYVVDQHSIQLLVVDGVPLQLALELGGVVEAKRHFGLQLVLLELLVGRVVVREHVALQQLLLDQLVHERLYTNSMEQVRHAHDGVDVEFIKDALLAVHDADVVVRDQQRIGAVLFGSPRERVASHVVDVVIGEPDAQVVCDEVALQLACAKVRVGRTQRHVGGGRRQRLVVVVVEDAVGVDFGRLAQHPGVLGACVEQGPELLRGIAEVDVGSVESVSVVGGA